MTSGFEWIIIIVTLLVASFLLHKKFEQEFTLGEYIGGAVALTISAIATIMLIFYSTTNLADDDRINSHITHVKWEEAHESSYEVCVSKDKDGNCTRYETRCSSVPDAYMAYDSVGNVFSLSRSQFLSVGAHFRTPMTKEWHNYANDFCDDGYWFYYTWGGAKQNKIPSAKKHHYVNYIKASHSVLKVYGRMRGYEKDLVTYPAVYEGFYGPFYMNRVIDKDSLIPQELNTWFNTELCYHNSYLGPKKEANIIVYFTSRDRDFTYALHEAWCGGKKNDIVVLVGMDKYPKISWVEILSWTPHEGFKIKLRDQLQKIGTVRDREMFINTIVSQINAPGESGFDRLHMSDMQYLMADISLPWWAYIVSSLIIVLLYAPLLIWFFKNDIMTSLPYRNKFNY
jgi:hypothetical protein